MIDIKYNIIDIKYILLALVFVVVLGIIPTRTVMLGIIIIFAYYALYKRENPITMAQENFESEVEKLNSIMNQIREYRLYNPQTYHILRSLMAKFVKYGDNLQHPLEHPNHTFEAVLELKGKILNNFHSFIYSIPHQSVVNNKYHIVMNKLRDILDEWVKISYGRMSQQYIQRGINIDTQFNYYKYPKAVDPMRDDQYEYW